MKKIIIVFRVKILRNVISIYNGNSITKYKKFGYLKK